MLIAPLYSKFKNAANPERFFKKQFIAAALVSVAVSYSATGAIVYNIGKSEWEDKKDDFHITDLLSFNLIQKHGVQGSVAVGLSYVGDISFLYTLAGIAFWRRHRNQSGDTPKPPQNN